MIIASSDLQAHALAVGEIKNVHFWACTLSVSFSPSECSSSTDTREKEEVTIVADSAQHALLSLTTKTGWNPWIMERNIERHHFEQSETMTGMLISMQVTWNSTDLGINKRTRWAAV